MSRAVPRLHVVTDDATLARPGWIETAARVLEEGGDRVALHVRGPRTAGRSLFELAGALLPRSRRMGALLVLNDRVDVALACGVDAVQLGWRSPVPADARALLGTSAFVGVSCHSAGEVERAGADGADWVFAGTVFPTPSHPDREEHGVAWVAEVVERAATLPVVAIGGVGTDRVGALRRTGVHGVAVLRGVWDAPDPLRAVREYIQALTD